jgi:hypothetical protein
MNRAFPLAQRFTDLDKFETCCLPRCITRTVFSEPLDHAIEIAIAAAKSPCEPVPTSFGDTLAVRDHVELTGGTSRTDGFNAQALLDEGHETRDLGLVVLSRRAVNDFDLHSVLQSSSCRSE